MISENNNNMNNTIDDVCGFSYFNDGHKFKYLDDGRIAYKTKCSSWSEILMNNMPLDSKIESDMCCPKLKYNFKSNIKINKKSNENEKMLYSDLCCHYCLKEFKEETNISWIKMIHGDNISVCSGECLQKMKTINSTLEYCIGCDKYSIIICDDCCNDTNDCNCDVFNGDFCATCTYNNITF